MEVRTKVKIGHKIMFSFVEELTSLYFHCILIFLLCLQVEHRCLCFLRQEHQPHPHPGAQEQQHHTQGFSRRVLGVSYPFHVHAHSLLTISVVNERKEGKWKRGKGLDLGRDGHQLNKKT